MRALGIISVLLFSFAACFSQSLPPNIGFEEGNFSHWVCSAGTIDTLGNITLSAITPNASSFVIYGPADSAMVDPVGKFPVRSPNGSNYSIRLGDTLHGETVRRVSYTFKIVPGASSVVFDYAVVLQNASHPFKQRPKFFVKVYDVSDYQYLQCPVFEYSFLDSLAGFVKAGDVSYKNWSAATIDLKNFIGKTVRLEFTVNHCSKNVHYCYTYLDIDQNPDAGITGNAYCLQQNAVNLSAPVGFQTYTWYSGDLSQQLGTGQRLTISPPPPDKISYAVVVSPYQDDGCPDTLFTVVNKIYSVFTLKVADTVYGCPGSSVDLTAPSITEGTTPGSTFTYFTDAAADTPLDYPNEVTRAGKYYIEGMSPQGCTAIEPVYVDFDLPVLKITNPPVVSSPVHVDLTLTFIKQPGITYGYYIDSAATEPLPDYRNVTVGGTYYIKATNSGGCSVIKPVIIIVDAPPYTVTAPTAFTPNGDGINDRFALTLTGYVNFGSLRIYNRDGAFIFMATSPNQYWDGSKNGQPLPAGVYYWLFEGENTFNHIGVKQGGSITLIR